MAMDASGFHNARLPFEHGGIQQAFLPLWQDGEAAQTGTIDPGVKNQIRKKTATMPFF
jgi:hypothetical protein